MAHKIILIIITLAGVAELLTIRIWLSCHNFTDIFHHTSINLALQIQSLAAAEKGTPLLLTRLFNNKATTGTLDVLRLYLQFWDIRFGANWFSLVGYFGIFAGVYYIVSRSKRTISHWSALGIIVLLPFIEILLEPPLPIFLKAPYLWLPFSIFSLYGIYQFLIHGSRKKRMIFLLILIELSILWVPFISHDLLRYCLLK